ncbi:MAG: class I SAM-dependent methyltransferase [Halobacteriota archaeon]|nr:class I SAM-dependent methyltransferase [Halobacteriota archaeon]
MEEGSRKSVKKVFEEWSKGSFGPSMERIHPLLHRWWLKDLKLTEDGRVLDMSCGFGWASRIIASMVPDGEVVGIDFAEGMIKNARQLASQDKSHNSRNLRFEVADAEDIPFLDDYFDCAICIDSFAWYPNPESALQEIKRVLKPGGVLYLADTPDSLLLRPYLKVWKVFSSSIDGWNPYSVDEFREFLEAEFIDVYQKRGQFSSRLLGVLMGADAILTVGKKGSN